MNISVNKECKYHITVTLMIIISGSPRTCNESQITTYIVVTIYNLYHTRVVPIIAYSSPRVDRVAALVGTILKHATIKIILFPLLKQGQMQVDRPSFSQHNLHHPGAPPIIIIMAMRY